MIRNVIKCGVNFILKLIPLDNKVILFESVSDMSDNSKAIFDYLVKTKRDKKYKIYWIVENDSDLKNKYKNINFILKESINIKDKLRKRFIFSRAKYCFYTHNFIGVKDKKNQVRCFLTHGTPLKDSRGYFWDVNINTEIISTSEFASELRCKSFYGGYDKVHIFGFPRNDKLFDENKGIIKKLKYSQYKKIILWMPTFKHNKNVISSDFEEEKESDIGILNNIFFESINNKLINTKTLLIIKPHPNQNMSYFNINEKSNIKLVTNKMLSNIDVDVYDLLGISDALITDFSSVFLDYLLLDKPIAFDLYDYRSYKNGRGFLVENPQEFMPGFKIYNNEDFERFIENVSLNNDSFKNERQKMMYKFHKYIDGNSAKRIVDFYKL